MRRKLANYHYDRPGIVMLTLMAQHGITLCHISADSFALSSVGAIIERDLRNIPSYYPQLGIDDFQVMPNHLHVIVHTYQALPAGRTLQIIMRGFKIGVNRKCREAGMDIRVFEDGFYDQIILNEEHLKRERVYIRDNVRQLRMKRANPELFTSVTEIRATVLPPDVQFQGIGNLFLLDRPLKTQIQFSRSTTEAQWRVAEQEILRKLDLGYVFVSPFISPCEKKALDLVLENGGSCIHLVSAEIGPHYKPAGRYFDMCCQGRLLELAPLRMPTQCAYAGNLRAGSSHLRAATEWPYEPHKRADFLFLNTLSAHIAEPPIQAPSPGT